jgi:Ca2+/H+ antiporter
MIKLWELLSGWKSVLGYILANIEWVTGNPMLLGAFKAAMEDPSNQNIANLIAHAMLALGVADRIRKNIVES